MSNDEKEEYVTSRLFIHNTGMDSLYYTAEGKII